MMAASWRVCGIAVSYNFCGCCGEEQWKKGAAGSFGTDA